MWRAADPRRRVIELARARFAQRDQLFHGLHRQRRMHHDHVRSACRQCDRCEVAQRFVRHLAQEWGQGEAPHSPANQRIAVGRRLRHAVAPDNAAASGAVIDDPRRPEPSRHAICDEPRDDVVYTAGRIRHDEAHRFHGIRLRGPRPAASPAKWGPIPGHTAFSTCCEKRGPSPIFCVVTCAPHPERARTEESRAAAE